MPELRSVGGERVYRCWNLPDSTVIIFRAPLLQHNYTKLGNNFQIQQLAFIKETKVVSSVKGAKAPGRYKIACICVAHEFPLTIISNYSNVYTQVKQKSRNVIEASPLGPLECHTPTKYWLRDHCIVNDNVWPLRWTRSYQHRQEVRIQNIQDSNDLCTKSTVAPSKVRTISRQHERMFYNYSSTT